MSRISFTHREYFTKFAPDAFAGNIGKGITVVCEGQSCDGTVVSAVVSDDGSEVSFEIDVEDEDFAELFRCNQDFTKKLGELLEHVLDRLSFQGNAYSRKDDVSGESPDYYSTRRVYKSLDNDVPPYPKAKD